MDDERQRVDHLAVEHDVELDEVALLVAHQLVVERRVAARAGLQRVKEIVNDLVERQLVVDVDAVGVEILHVLEHAAALLTKLHDVADKLARRIDVRVRDRLLGELDQRRVRVIRRVVDRKHGAVGFRDVVDDAWRGRDEVEVVLALEALLDDLHVQKAEEAAAEAEAERHGGFRLKGQRGVVELQLFERVAQVGVVRAVRRVNAAEHHRLHRAVARQRLFRGVVHPRDRIADARLAHVLDRRRDVADLARRKAVRRLERGRAQVAALDDRKLAADRHHADRVARVHAALLDAHIGDDALVRVVVGVEDQRLQRRVGVALGRGDVGDDLLHDRLDVDARLCADARRILGGNADDVLDLRRHAVRVRGDQVDLVEHRDDLEPGVHREIRVRERLRLDALRSVDDEHRALARRERPRDLVVEVDVAGRVDQVKGVVLAVVGAVGQRDGMRLDRDAALALEVHVVEQLLLHVAQGDGLRLLENAVGKRALAVVNMCNDAEIPDSVLFQCPSSSAWIIFRLILFSIAFMRVLRKIKVGAGIAPRPQNVYNESGGRGPQRASAGSPVCTGSLCYGRRPGDRVLWALPAGAARGGCPRGRLFAQARFVMGAGPGVAFFGRSRRAAFINFDLKGDFHAQIFYNRHTV